MEKKFKSFEIAALKTTAKAVNTLVTKKNKLIKQLNKIQKDIEENQTFIDKWEFPIKDTFGYSTEELVDKVVEDTGKVDKDNRPIKVTKYVLKYPETIIPISNKDENIMDAEFENTNSVDTDESIEAFSNSFGSPMTDEEAKEVYEDIEASKVVDTEKEEF